MFYSDVCYKNRKRNSSVVGRKHSMLNHSEVFFACCKNVSLYCARTPEMQDTLRGPFALDTFGM